MKKILSLALALIMVLGMMPLTAMAEASEPYWEIQIYSELANYAGLQTGWFAKLLKDKFNVGVNIISASEGGSDRWATQMISRDLGDLVMLGDNNGQQHLSEAVEAGLLLDISGLIDEHAPNIATNYPLLLEKARIQFGNGTAVYAIGSEAVPTTNDLQIEGGTDSWWGPYGRWDLYAKLGYPEIKTIEDLVPVLQQMHDLEPVNADGEPTYAMSLFKDWDGGTMMAATQFYAIFGYGDQWNYVFPHATEDSYITLLDEDGIYFRTLKFYFDLNQLGLLDPDSITEETFASQLYTAGLPEVDLLIRTSGEMRLSNFLLYQCAYAEFVFPTVLWPDFDLRQYHQCIAEFQGRKRRFGKRDEE